MLDKQDHELIKSFIRQELSELLLNLSRSLSAEESSLSKVEVHLRAGNSFSYKWPNFEDKYKYSQIGKAIIGEMDIEVKIGFIRRSSYGGREYAIIFLNGRPLSEGVSTDDGEQYISILKNADNKYVKAGMPIPIEEKGLPIVKFRDYINVKGSTNSYGVIANKKDLSPIVRYGLIRARFKGLI